MTTMIADELGRIPMSPFLTATLTRAAEYATAQAHREVTLEHLLLALCEDPEATVVMKSSSVDLARLTVEVSDFLGRIEDRVEHPGAQAVMISADLRRILEAAAAAAQQGRRREINGAIVLAAIVGDAKSTAAHLLRNQGLTFEEAIRALQRATASPQQASPTPVTGPAPPPRMAPPETYEPMPAPRATVPMPPPDSGRPASTEEILASARERLQSRLPPEPPAAPPPAPAPQPAAAPAAAPAPLQRPNYPELGTQPRYAEPPPSAQGPGRLQIDPEPSAAPTEPTAGPPPRAPYPDLRAPAPPMPPPTAPQAPARFGAPPAAAPQQPVAQPQGYSAPQPPETRRASSGPFVGQWPLIESGKLVENIPRRMRAGVPMLVEARIARADVKAITEGLQGGGAVFSHEIVVTKAMSVRLKAPGGGFWIETRSPETQWIEKMLDLDTDDFARWRWTVTPRQSGRRQLQLIVSARTIGADGVTAETALPDQTIDVRVSINYARAAGRWLGWTAAAIVGGLLAKFGESGFVIVKLLAKKYLG
jgi:hypothetical protein